MEGKKMDEKTLEVFVNLLRIVVTGRRDIKARPELLKEMKATEEEMVRGICETFDFLYFPEILAATDLSLVDSGDKTRIASATATAWLRYCAMKNQH